MKSYSLHQQPTYSLGGNELRINFNHKSVERETDAGVETQWECDQVLLPVTATREQIVDAISEIDPGQAETLADGWINS
jgi:hypothetical protein